MPRLAPIRELRTERFMQGPRKRQREDAVPGTTNQQHSAMTRKRARRAGDVRGSHCAEALAPTPALPAVPNGPSLDAPPQWLAVEVPTATDTPFQRDHHVEGVVFHPEAAATAGVYSGGHGPPHQSCDAGALVEEEAVLVDNYWLQRLGL
jgi:hypothetical protein